MYKDFYRFSEEPFALDPDPKFLYLAPSHAQALSCMMQGIQERKGVTVVTGEVGVGKTLLVYALLKDLNPKIKTAFIFQTSLNFENLLMNALQELKASWRPEEDNLVCLLAEFRKYLHERLANDETVAIVIDEAQALSEEILKNLFRLYDRDPVAKTLLQIVLVGHPELNPKLNSEKMRLFRNTIGFRCQIRPLAREEGMEYIKYRLNLVGRDMSDVLTSEATSRIWEFADGVPRIMNVLCDLAFRIGETYCSPKIDAKIIREAVRSIAYLRPSRANKYAKKQVNKNTRNRMIKFSFFLFAVCIFFISVMKILCFLFRAWAC
jgi:general secretion pathway protein A